jgi:hypothetical protein
MHFLNNGKHALVFPARCGTRWIAEKLYNNKILNTLGPHHRFEWDDSGYDVEIFMFVRNPFIRERSIYRWFAETGQITFENCSFEDYVNSNMFHEIGSWYTEYGDLNNKVQHIHLENINDFLKEKFDIADEYDNSYHMADDGLNDATMFGSSQVVDTILLKYQEDLKHIQFDLTNYTV